MDIHKEKVARREVGSLAASKNVTRSSKVTAPAQKERAQRAARVVFDFSALDHIGHGVKVADPMKDVGRGIKSQPTSAEVTVVELRISKFS